MFQSPGYISIGDEYDKKNQIPDRYKGKGFKTTPGKKGSGSDATFSKKFLSLSEGDKYVDPGTFEKRSRLDCEKKKLTPDGFRYTNPTKKAAGSGAWYGCFSEKNPPKHEVEFHVLNRGEMPNKVKPQDKNIVTGPAKRGTYGVPGTTLSKGDEYKYISDPYEGEKRKEAIAAKESTKRVVGPSFKSTCKRSEFFDGTGRTGVSKVYGLDKPLPAKKEMPEDKKGPLSKPWRPSSPSKGGYNATIMKFPDYQEDPYEAKEKAMREARRKEKPPTVWKPISTPHSLPTRSIKYTPAA